MGFSSRRSSNKSKASASSSSVWLPALLEQHVPRRARTLLSALSDDDREVLTYMLAFGLHLQMLVGVAFPAQKLQWKSWNPSSSSFSKAGLKCEHVFPSPSPSSKQRFRSTKASPSSPFAHRTCCSCDCFSCYSSFWSRWVASPNRDLLSKIIEITELAEEEDEEQKGEAWREKAKKQEKKHTSTKVVGRRKGKADIWKLHAVEGTAKPSLSSHLPKEGESMEALHSAGIASASTSTDVMYDSPRHCPGMEEGPGTTVCGMPKSTVLVEGTDRICFGAEKKDASVLGVLPMQKQLRVAGISDGSASPQMPIEHSNPSEILEDGVHGSFPAQALPGDHLQSKGSLRLPHAVKRKSNQIMPLNFDGMFTVMEEEEEIGQLNECSEVFDGPIVHMGANNARDGGVLSRVFPHAFCDIASRLWDLVSLGPQNHMSGYY